MSVMKPISTQHTLISAQSASGNFSRLGYIVTCVTLALFTTLSLPSNLLAQKIAILQSSDAHSHKIAIQIFKKQMAPYTTFVEYNLNGDITLGKQQAQKIRDSDASIVLAIGLKATMAAKVELVNIPVIYAMVLNPKSYDLNAKNMIGVSHQISVLTQLNSLRMVFPDIKRLGVIHNPEKTSSFTKRDIQKAAKLGFTVIERPLANENAIPKTLRGIIPAIDGLVLLSDSTLLTQESFSFILKETLEHRIPLIGFSSLITQSGALCSIAHSPIDVGYTLAELAKKTFDQSSLPWGSTISVQQQTISLNTHTAEYLNIPITEKITNNADEIF